MPLRPILSQSDQIAALRAVVPPLLDMARGVLARIEDETSNPPPGKAVNPAAILLKNTLRATVLKGEAAMRDSE